MGNCHTVKKECCGSNKAVNLKECGCHGSNAGLRRRFVSPAEKKEQLEKYKDELEKELKGVEEEFNKYSSN